MFDNGFVSHHLLQLWVLQLQEVDEVTHEVVDHVCLITLSHCVQVNGRRLKPQSKPLFTTHFTNELASCQQSQIYSVYVNNLSSCPQPQFMSTTSVALGSCQQPKFRSVHVNNLSFTQFVSTISVLHSLCQQPQFTLACVNNLS